MNRFWQKFILAIGFAGSLSAQAATSLSTGDIAFVGFNLDSNDDFAFVLLKDVDASTEIRFTDQGINNPGTFVPLSGDGEMVWTSGSALSAGTVVTIAEFTLAASTGTVVQPADMTMSSIGDQLFAFQGSLASPTIITGMHSNESNDPSTDGDWSGSTLSNSTSALPDVLTNGINAIRLHNASTEYDNWQFKCTGGIVSGTATEVATSIYTLANWNYDNVGAFDPLASACTYIVTAAADTDGSLTTAGGVTEPVAINTTVDTTGEAVNVFDFTLSDGGTADGQALSVCARHGI